ncbi:P-loop containing nucleoside triphosphate hydrolase protein [Trametopsis cervina]|nr:P-loop containing nucleoside triphosphate hydrolase protein [Trametopsis cervina]
MPQAYSAAGKTQLAMQLALCVQIPGDLGGVSGGACFLSTSWTLPTNRLVEIVHNHPVLSPAFCGLADIHTMKTPTIPLLLHALSNTFPPFLEERASDPNTKPIKLLVIDAITELFHSEDRVSVSTLSERSRNLTEIATLLHTLTHKHGLAVVVLNEVSDVFDRGPPPGVRAHELIYRDQARLFGRADAGWGAKKEAALGLVWANQINARIMLVRTERMRVLDETEYRPAKRRRMEDGAEEARTRVEAEAVRIRRLDVIFNSVGHPASLDYIITSGGFVALEPEEEELSHNSVQPTVRTQNLSDVLEEVCPFDLPLAVPSSSAGPSSDLISSLPSSGNFAPAVDMAAQNGGEVEEGPDPEDGPVEEDDEWEAYWKDGDIGSDIYSQVDLDALSSVK